MMKDVERDGRVDNARRRPAEDPPSSYQSSARISRVNCSRCGARQVISETTPTGVSGRRGSYICSECYEWVALALREMTGDER